MKFVMILLVCQYQVICEHGDSAPSSTTNDEPHKQTTDENKNLPEDLPNPTGGDGKDSVKDDEKRSERDLQTCILPSPIYCRLQYISCKMCFKNS